MAARLLRVLLVGLAVSCAGFANQGMAAIAPLSPSQLEDKAEEIFTGKVLSITEEDRPTTRLHAQSKFIDRTYTIAIGVISVHKFKSVTVASQVKVQAWKPVGGKQPGLVGPQGHVPIPKKGDLVTVYTTRSEANNDSKSITQDNKSQLYVPLLPNGIVIRKSTPTKVSSPKLSQSSPAETKVGGNSRTLQTLSKSSSFQFMATITLYREMLVHSWDEKLYRQFSYYHGLNQASLSELAKTYESDETWGPWFKERATYQASVYEALQPYIVKKRKGESMTAQDNAELTQIQREVTAKLGR